MLHSTIFIISLHILQYATPELVEYLNWLGSDHETLQDPNERRRLALAEIDKAPFGWYHIRAIVVAGIGFFTDAYDVS